MTKKDEQKDITESLEYIIANMATKDDVAFLENKFEDRFNGLESRITAVENNVSKIPNLENKINDIYNMLDNSTAKIVEDEMERASLGYKIERHDGWIKTIAKEVNVELAEA